MTRAHVRSARRGEWRQVVNKTKRPILTWEELERLRAKADAVDEAVTYLKGRMDSEKLMTVYRILTSNDRHAVEQ